MNINLSTVPSWVVVEDMSGEYWEGAVVDRQKAHVLEARGVAMLPCVPELFRMSSVAGYSKRAWGAGIAMRALVPEMIAPLTLYCVPSTRGVAWKARLVPDGPRRGQYEGFVRFSADSGQRSPMNGAYQELGDKPVFVRELASLDEEGGWVVGGKGLASFGVEGHYGFGIWGTAPGIRVVWVAATMVPITA
jgi:hypothetical protein